MAKPKVKKEYLLEISYEIAIEEGLSALNVRRICTLANIAVGTFYNYFPSIEALTHATAILFFERHVRDKICLPQEGETFLNYIENIYPVLKDALTTFNQNWVEQFRKHSRKFDTADFLVQSGIVAHGCHQLALLIDRDVEAGELTLPENLTTALLSEFTITNILNIIEHEKDPSVLFWVLKAIYTK